MALQDKDQRNYNFLEDYIPNGDSSSNRSLTKYEVKSNEDIFPLSKVLNEVIYTINVTLQDKKTINYPCLSEIDDYAIVFDEYLLECTLFNLITVCLKYSEEGTSIDIQVSPYNDSLLLEITCQCCNMMQKERMLQNYHKEQVVLYDSKIITQLDTLVKHMKNSGGNVICQESQNKEVTFVMQVPMFH